MSEQKAVGDAWGDDISEERKAVLEQRLQAWQAEADHGERKGPFDGVPLTGADVFWLAARTLQSTGDVQVTVEQMEQLRSAHDNLTDGGVRARILRASGV